MLSSALPGLRDLGGSASPKDQQLFDKLTGVYIDLKLLLLDCLEARLAAMKAAGAGEGEATVTVAAQIASLAAELTSM